MWSRAVGGVLLIVGTSIGAGMLALPVANAHLGFFPSNGLLIICWLMMTYGAFFMLEASLYVQRGQHLVSMAQVTIGHGGLLVTYFSYLFLLYALLAAYISGGADVLGGLMDQLHIKHSEALVIILFTCVLGMVVYQGMRPVDWVNRILMFVKLGVYLVLVGLMVPHVSLQHFMVYTWHVQGSLFMILITAFGFAIIVPNLRDYFERDKTMLCRVFIIGSSIPLCCYMLWDYVILGSISAYGSQGLIALQHSQHTVSDLALYITHQAQNQWISTFFHIFTVVCMFTAFLGVALSLMSFLSDAFKLPLQGLSGIFIWSTTFFPPMLIVLYWPNAYLLALSYAGSCCVVLLMLLPAIMCIQGRKHFPSSWRVPGGDSMPWILVSVAVVVLLSHIT